MKKLMIAAVLCSTAAFAAEPIRTETAPDGVNTITTYADGTQTMTLAKVTTTNGTPFVQRTVRSPLKAVEKLEKRVAYDEQVITHLFGSVAERIAKLEAAESNRVAKAEAFAKAREERKAKAVKKIENAQTLRDAIKRGNKVEKGVAK